MQRQKLGLSSQPLELLYQGAFFPSLSKSPACKDIMKRKKEFEVHSKPSVLLLWRWDVPLKDSARKGLISGQDHFPWRRLLESKLWYGKTRLKQLKAAIPIVSSGDSIILLNDFVPSPNSLHWPSLKCDFRCLYQGFCKCKGIWWEGTERPSLLHSNHSSAPQETLSPTFFLAKSYVLKFSFKWKLYIISLYIYKLYIY